MQSPQPEAVPLPGPSFSIYTCHVGEAQDSLEASAGERVERCSEPLSSDEGWRTQSINWMDSLPASFPVGSSCFPLSTERSWDKCPEEGPRGCVRRGRPGPLGGDPPLHPVTNRHRVTATEMLCLAPLAPSQGLCLGIALTAQRNCLATGF